MLDAIYLGAYWQARYENVEQCSSRVWSVIEEIKSISPLFDSWYPRKATVEEPTGSPITTRAGVESMLKRSRRDSDGGIIEEFGFFFGAWNGEYGAKSAGIDSRIGAASARAKNSLVLSAPRDPYQLTGGETQRVFEILINATDPDYATVSSHQCRKKVQKKNEFVFGWMGYLKGVPSPRSSLRVAGHGFAEGAILASKIEEFSSTNEEHIEVVKELNGMMEELGWKR
jgi:hypothetical protein